MIEFHPINLEIDYPTLESWWKEHGAIPCPKAFLPQGAFAAVNGSMVAAGFLYLVVGGKLAMVEYLTVNPAFSGTKTSLVAFKALLEHFEAKSVENGCEAIISMVAPGTSEERIMGRAGYITSEQVPHVMFGKRLVREEALCP